MDDRKDYVAPAIAAEDVLEQTSLSCMVTEPYTGAKGAAFASGLDCTSNVAKGGVFIKSGCTTQAPKPSELVVLS
jgi:hypothetical protein